MLFYSMLDYVQETETVNPRKSNSYLMPILWKVLCIALIAFCVVVGLIGLILPIIPGFIFLFIAAILLARISSRFKSFLTSNSNMKAWMQRADTINTLSIFQRIRLGFWLSARILTNSVEAVVRQFKKSMGNS